MLKILLLSDTAPLSVVSAMLGWQQTFLQILMVV